MTLFEASEAANRRRAQPLAARMRPASLDEFYGQQHILGKESCCAVCWRPIDSVR